MLISPINLWLGLTAFINLALGLSIYFKSPKTKTNIFYTLTVLSAAFWTFCMLMFRVSEETYLGLWSTTLWVSTVPIVFFFLYFSLNFLSEKGLKKRLKIVTHLLIIVPSLIVGCIVILSEGLFKEIVYVNGERGFVFNLPIFYFYCIYIVSYFTIAFVVLFKKYFRSNKVAKAQLAFIILGTLISSLAGVVFGLILTLLGSFKFYWLSPGLTIVMTGFITYAIIKHHLMNVKVITTEIFGVLISIILLMDALLSETITKFLLKFGLFIIVSFFSYLLIRSVIKEVQSREKIQKLATDLTSANTELKRLDNAKSEFLSIASHQLRTPLTSIKGYSSMILEGDYGETTDKIKEIVNKIFQSSQKLVLMIDDFLNISRIEAGKMKYDFTKFDLRKTINDIVNDFLANNQKAQELNLKFIAEASIFDINADQNKISQVISNLIDNAVKYTEKGFVKVSLSQNNRTNTFLINIQDSGAGISRKVLPRLFQKFSRAAKISRLHTDGSGLGLYVAKRIVQAHQGKIWAESRGEDKGSTFFVELPIN